MAIHAHPSTRISAAYAPAPVISRGSSSLRRGSPIVDKVPTVCIRYGSLRGPQHELDVDDRTELVAMPDHVGVTETLGRGLVVLGSHRSGTSAVTGAIDSLGLPACRHEDRFPSDSWNARGYFESASVSVFDEHLLALLGGRWYAPPLPRRGWATRRSLEGWRQLASQLFAAAHPTTHWVWKDPRACVLMPFWETVFGPDVPRIVMLRHPFESAGSLAARNDLRPEESMALVERNLRTSLRDSAGRPVLVTTYDEMLSSPDEWCQKVAAFIRANSLPLPEPLRLKEAAGSLASELRHYRALDPDSTNRRMPLALQRLWAWAIDRVGTHTALSVDGLPLESPATGRILRAAL